MPLTSSLLECVVESIHMDPQGKYAIMVFTLWSHRYVIVNVYIPPLFLFGVLEVWSVPERFLTYLLNLPCSIWSDVVIIIKAFTSTPVSLAIEICLLGLVDNLIPTRVEKTLFSRLLFYARKAITCGHTKCGCPEKDDKAWSKWLADPTTSS